MFLQFSGFWLLIPKETTHTFPGSGINGTTLWSTYYLCGMPGIRFLPLMVSQFSIVVSPGILVNSLFNACSF